MRPKILVLEPEDFTPAAAERLRALGEVELSASHTLAEAFAGYDVVWMRLGHRVDARALGPSPRCRILACAVTGLDHIDLEACAARGVEVLSLRGEVDFLRQVRATVELTLALALALLRKIPAAAASVLDGEWARDRFRGRELYGKTVGIVGMGRLGTLVAELFAAFGMEVIGYDPRPDFPTAAARRVDRLDELLAASDLVSLHVAYDESTHHLIAEPQLAAMRAGSYLINTSRGGVVDSAALHAALRSGRLAGAALDVVEGEPALGRDHPLVAYAREHDNLLIVPHVGGNTVESFAKTERFLADKIAAAIEAW